MNSFDFLQRDIVGRAVLELGRPWRFVRRNMRGRFEGTAILQVDGDAGGAETVVVASQQSMLASTSVAQTSEVGRRQSVPVGKPSVERWPEGG